MVAPSSGDFVVAELFKIGQRQGEGDTTFKQYKLRGMAGGTASFDLVPLNPEFDTISVNKARPGRIIGTIVEHRRRLRRKLP